MDENHFSQSTVRSTAKQIFTAINHNFSSTSYITKLSVCASLLITEKRVMG